MTYTPPAELVDALEARSGPLVGSPEYLADPIKLARAEKRRREHAEAVAAVAYPIIRRAVLQEVAGWLREQGSDAFTEGAIAPGVHNWIVHTMADRIEKDEL